VKGRTAILGSPLAVSLLYRGLAGCGLGRPDWRNDMRTGIAMQRSVAGNGSTLVILIGVAYAFSMLTGAKPESTDGLTRCGAGDC
jgi:O-antigen ligase